MRHIEIVVPCFNEQECIRPLYNKVEEILKNIEDIKFSFLFVNDGSKDKTLLEIKSLVMDKGSDAVKYISFARNFGKESGIYAGLEKSRGDYVVLMDADLQHPPELIPDMLKAMDEGYDCCGARRVSRKGEPLIRSFFSNYFYNLFGKMTGMHLVPGGSDYRMMSRQMVEAILSLTERERFTKGIMSWVGFDTKWIDYENVERLAGESKWSFWGLAKYAWNGFIGFATTPLKAAVYIGLITVLISIVEGIKLFVRTMKYGTSGNGFVTIVLLIFLLSGVIITILGVIGEYLARIYLELKRRPIYIAKETNIEEENIGS